MTQRLLRLAIGFVLLLALAAVATYVGVALAPADEYIFLPDRAHAVAPIVEVQGERPTHDAGGIYFVDIFVRKASLLEAFCIGNRRETWVLRHAPHREVCAVARRTWPGKQEGAQLVPAVDVVPKGTSETQRRQFDARAMTRSQQLAAAVAFRAAGLHVVARPTGVLVDEVDGNAPAAGKLQPTDVIVSANGRRVRTPRDLRAVVGALKPGATVRLTVRRGDTEKRLDVRTIRGSDGRTLIGIVIDQAADVKLPRDVKINAGSVGGPSAGLAFALDVLEELGKDVDHGRKVAATGEIGLDGTVLPIGGIRQKTIGVRRSGIHVFLVPAGDNANDARRYAHGVRIVPVRNFQQALHSLATLPKTVK